MKNHEIQAMSSVDYRLVATRAVRDFGEPSSLDIVAGP